MATDLFRHVAALGSEDPDRLHEALSVLQRELEVMVCHYCDMAGRRDLGHVSELVLVDLVKGVASGEFESYRPDTVNDWVFRVIRRVVNDQGNAALPTPPPADPPPSPPDLDENQEAAP